ncbi:uracil-DNA glycosylase family protein [uncultured Eudoraea sp.]|uniref:uracil-DNA glycosylase family protein n=1 Tax=uncultured Eudoraea sp. TaxID=1035614 RepID=UPI0026019B95|nr:uracil-DNA glycosylase family protein [uncultured Eudoraea sp.]
MFLHAHPYDPFLFDDATKLIVGTLPPPRFTTRELREGDVDFCYGSRNGQLWPILDHIFGLNLKYETTNEAVKQRVDFLIRHKIGICDIVESAQRTKIDASDLGMKNVSLRNLIGFLHKYRKVDTLLFTGGNSKNGPEYFFRKQLREHGIKLKTVSQEIPRINEFILSEDSKRTVRTVSLTAPSGAANRAVGSFAAYKKIKAIDPEYTTLQFRVDQYRSFF